MALSPQPTDCSSSSLSGLILLRAVQRLEAQQGKPLDDAQAMHAAHAGQRGAAADRLLARARWLAREQGLDLALAQWRGRLVWVALAAAGLVGLLSWGLLQAVVGSSTRQINAVAALLAVLGPHLLSLLLWLLMLATGSSEGGGLARWGAWVAARLPGAAPAQKLVLEAGIDVLDQQPRLSVWAFGALNHAIWSLALLLTLGCLLLAFSFLAYRLSWESTILDAGFFAGFARLSGWLPAQLGFAMPDLTGADGDNRGWALWLLGCTLVYGLGLRLLLLAISLWRSRRLAAGLRVDESDPALRRLLARFAAMDAASEVLDREQRPAARPPGPAGEPATWRVTEGTALLGFELPEALQPWPPQGLAAPLQARIAGSAAEKQAWLARLQAAAPQRLLLVCHAPSSPDRGSERFLREALKPAGQGALLLLGGSGAQRWKTWALDCGLPLAAVFDSPAAAARWLEIGHG
jgi:hypothetical protein